MTAFPEPIKSTELIVHRPGILAKIESRFRTLQDVASRYSFKTQISDCRNLHPFVPLRNYVLARAFSSPQTITSKPKPFQGSCTDLCNQITNMVHATIDDMDYNGLQPYLKAADQLEEGKTFNEINIDGQNEQIGSTCVGMSHVLLRRLKEEHGIEGSLAVERKGAMHPFQHAAVIIECSDGYVLLEARSNPSNRIFQVPFDSTNRHPQFTLTAAKAGSTIPIKVKYEKVRNHPERTTEYCIHVENGGDLVMKHYLMESSLHFVPISVYNPDGSANKYIKVMPTESKIVLINSNDRKEEEITFKSILEDGVFSRLEAFMEPDITKGDLPFHTSVGSVHQQIVKFATQHERIKKLFTETYADETF